MTKMEMIERFYGRNEELERTFAAAEKAGDAAAMDACQDAYQDLLQEVRAEGEAFGDMMRLYSDMKKHGNSHLDLSGTYREPEKILKTFREFGVTEFTFSSSWSSAIQVAWAFTQMGCTLKGMTEINGSGRKFMSKEYEKVPAFLFSL
jgi:predicted CopG family antitoxin